MPNQYTGTVKHLSAAQASVPVAVEKPKAFFVCVRQAGFGLRFCKVFSA